MASVAYRHGTVTIGVAASVLCTVDAPSNGVLVQNRGAVDVYIGGTGVTADNTATGGIKVSAGTTLTVPSNGLVMTDLYAIAASTTAAVAWLQIN